MPMDLPSSRTLGQLIHEMAARFPRNIAIADTERALTYRDLIDESSVVSKGLLSLGIRRGDVVSILSGNSVQWAAVAIGALRIGAVLAPMNTWYKAAEFKHALEHSEAQVLFAANKLLKQNFDAVISDVMPDLADGSAARPPERKLRHLVQFSRTLPGAMSFADFAGSAAAVSDTELKEKECDVTPDDIAFILYTAGSTSSPKGVQLHHGPTIVNDFQIGERLGLDPTDRIWLGSPLFYGFALVNALPAAWTHGATILIQEFFAPEIAIELMHKYGATGYYGFGNMTRAILAAPSWKKGKLSSLSKGLSGFSKEDKRLTIEELGVKNCCSMYGLTESYGNCTVTDFSEPLEVKLETQGQVLPGWDIKIVDPVTEAPLPTGTVGHLLIRGFVTSGYYKNPQATKESFDKDGYFRTGDLASISSEGHFSFHSRLKEILKVGGINVSPHEIEEVLQSHQDVQQAYVVGIPDEVRGETVVAYVDKGESDVTCEQLQNFVRERVASFKVPSHIIFCTEATLPRLPTGKIPRYVLRQRAISRLSQPDVKTPA